MSERAYTVKELDALRRVVENRYNWGRYSGPVFVEGHAAVSHSSSPVERNKIIEERVRTHMLAGHTAEDLLASEQDA